jgi:hypothetical protein
MKNIQRLLPLLLMASVVEETRASVMTFEADYVRMTNQSCFSHIGCITLPNTPFSETFTLDSSQLALDGIYDVSSSLNPNPIFTPLPGSTFTISLIANAIVADLQVIDLVIHFLETTERDVGFSSPLTTSSSFDASGGNWSTGTSSSDPFGLGGSSSSTGTYTLQQPSAVPEPGSLLLLSGGLAALLGARILRKHRIDFRC